MENITDLDYSHAKWVCEKFLTKNIGQIYHLEPTIKVSFSPKQAALKRLK